MNKTIAYKGNIVTAPKLGELCSENAYLVAQGGIVRGVFASLEGTAYANAAIEDFCDALIVPSFCDVHLHAPQYPMLGTGMGAQLLDWLNLYTYKTEARFSDPVYAKEVYAALAKKLLLEGTTHVCAYASIHREATHILMRALDDAGISGFVGKVNMDRNCPQTLRETAEESLDETRRFLDECMGRYQRVRPIITPRFTVSCSDALMAGLGKLAEEYGVPVQSHLSESEDEIARVKKLHPDCAFYYETYQKFGLWKSGNIMAHGVHSAGEERRALRDAGILLAHCPDSNTNLASGIAPLRLMLDEGMKVALGSDIAAGAHVSMLKIAQSAIASSKARHIITKGRERFLTAKEAFYLITTAPRLHFGESVPFAAGSPLHALVLFDDALPKPAAQMTPTERLERIIHIGDSSNIVKVLL